MRQPRLLLADRQTLAVEGLRKLLEPHFEIVGSVEDGRELVAAARALKPDVVLLDTSLPGLNGIDAARQLKKELASPKFVFLTMCANPACVTGAFRAGASGYVLKQCASAELVEAIHEVLEGRTYVTPQAAKDVLVASLKAGESPGELTTREREVLQLVAEGKSVKEIAAILEISPKTVVFHKSNITGKLGFRTTAELTRYAIGQGISGA